MVLLLFIVKEEDRDSVSSALSEHGYQATMIATTGEFLQYGNTTFLLGCEPSQIDQIAQCIQAHTTVRFVEHVAEAKKALLHRAAIFVLPIDRHVTQPQWKES